MNNSKSVRIYTERIHLAVDYISEHLAEEISLDKLASVACFSPFHFHRIFSALLGESPRDYIERLRMERAVNEIAIKRNLNLYEIAYECGFNTKSSFSRVFKKYYGVAPSRFLQKHEADFHSTNVMGSKKTSQNKQSDFDAVEIIKLPTFHVAYTQTLEGYETGIPKAWNKLWQQLQLRGLFREDSTLIGIPYDIPESHRMKSAVIVHVLLLRMRLLFPGEK
jgi:AraC family transcriptional regulator